MDDDGNEVEVPAERLNNLEQLLIDADQMEEEEKERALEKENDDTSITDTVRNVLSTIVTADFFVVCGLLLWFLAGIFGSYVLKDDGIQIAFNGENSVLFLHLLKRAGLFAYNVSISNILFQQLFEKQKRNIPTSGSARSGYPHDWVCCKW